MRAGGVAAELEQSRGPLRRRERGAGLQRRPLLHRQAGQCLAQRGVVAEPLAAAAPPPRRPRALRRAGRSGTAPRRRPRRSRRGPRGDSNFRRAQGLPVQRRGLSLRPRHGRPPRGRRGVSDHRGVVAGLDGVVHDPGQVQLVAARAAPRAPAALSRIRSLAGSDPIDGVAGQLVPESAPRRRAPPGSRGARPRPARSARPAAREPATARPATAPRPAAQGPLRRRVQLPRTRASTASTTVARHRPSRRRPAPRRRRTGCRRSAGTARRRLAAVPPAQLATAARDSGANLTRCTASPLNPPSTRCSGWSRPRSRRPGRSAAARRQVGDTPAHVPQHVQRRLVGPVHVLDHQHRRRAADPTAPPDRCHQHGVPVTPGQRRGQRPAARATASRSGPSVRGVSRSSHAPASTRARPLDRPGERPHHARLADPRLAGEQHHRADAVPGGDHGGIQHAQLRIPFEQTALHHRIVADRSRSVTGVDPFPLVSDGCRRWWWIHAVRAGSSDATAPQRDGRYVR